MQRGSQALGIRKDPVQCLGTSSEAALRSEGTFFFTRRPVKGLLQTLQTYRRVIQGAEGLHPATGHKQQCSSCRRVLCETRRHRASPPRLPREIMPMGVCLPVLNRRHVLMGDARVPSRETVAELPGPPGGSHCEGRCDRGGSRAPPAAGCLRTSGGSPVSSASF